MQFGMVQIVYFLSSAIVVLLVILFGAGQHSGFVPQDKDVEQEKRWESKTNKETGKGGDAVASTN